MEDVVPFGLIILLAGAALLAAVTSNALSERIRVPAPALFLGAAALASDLWPALGGLSIRTDERIVTVALLLILFDGGMHIGRARFASAAAGIVWVGVAGTVVTAGALAAVAHLLLGFDWRLSLLLGAALAPTDPAVVFSVLGRREIQGRSGTLLEGESGVNDPVGIALMVALLGSTGLSGASAVGHGLGEFALQMAVGALVGLAAGPAILWTMRHLPLPNEALYPVRALACAPVVYGLGAGLHGSGFLAVFVAGIYLGDARAPYKREIERFSSGVATVAEIVAFTVLGLTVSLDSVVSGPAWWQGLLLAALLVVVARPLLVWPLLLPLDLRPGEKAFVLWAGLKGAVPILLGTYVLAADVAGGRQLYGIVFVVVLVSVAVQGGLVPLVARRCGVPMRVVEPQPWALGMRFSDEPRGLHRHVVATGAPADGSSLADLDLGEDAWISLVSRSGRLVQVRGGTVLRAGDEVLALAGEDVDLARVFGPAAG